MKIALVTGGSRGLGKSIALNLAKKGYDIILTYKSSQTEAENVVREITQLGCKAVSLQLDVAQTDTLANFVEKLLLVLNDRWGTSPKINLLVNNAGIGINAACAETTEVQFDELMNIHLKGPFFLTQMLLPYIADGGEILNLSSGLTRFSLPGYGVYAAMKGAIEVITRYLALELGERKITVNTIAPGGIETDFGGGALRDNQDINAYVASQTALGRTGLPDDIGAAVAAIASDDCRWMNGQRIELTGGMRL
ncbi:MAG: SDR family oxidoreductase [Sulfuricurvum sp.]|uniref:SDR family NAD(P)-dependent oxidoreductase n=1 Tax=Sulfuricurvum sp. TaxID=2025608 RepID=UPI002625D97C|nr:SDR family oxidoreductase [Sulfuricurvum sp.]MDD5161072.1 SDR family oxidoreductase [Sulfuricurvum sp.]